MLLHLYCQPGFTNAAQVRQNTLTKEKHNDTATKVCMHNACDTSDSAQKVAFCMWA